MCELSIIIPVYNVESYLKECIDSILEISKISYELILVDDGSTDRSGKICDFYQVKYGEERIKVIHKENSGVSNARNEGIRKATGNYITFVDSDDTVIAEQLKYALEQSYQNDLIISGINYIYSDQIVLKKLIETYIDFNVKDEVNDYYELLDKQYIFYAIYGKIYKKDIIHDNKILFNTEYSILEDSIFVWKYLEVCKKVKVIQNTFYNYRQNEGISLVKKYNTNAIDALIAKYNASNWIINLLNEENYKIYYADLFYKLVEYVERIYKEETINKAGKIIQDYFMNDEIKEICKSHQIKKTISIKRLILHYLVKKRNILLLGAVHRIK